MCRFICSFAVCEGERPTVNKLHTKSANDVAFCRSRLRRISRKSVLTWFWVQNEIKRFKHFLHRNKMFKYIYEEHNFNTDNLHCKLTQRRLYTKVGNKIQNAITATKVFTD